MHIGSHPAGVMLVEAAMGQKPSRDDLDKLDITPAQRAAIERACAEAVQLKKDGWLAKARNLATDTFRELDLDPYVRRDPLRDERDPKKLADLIPNDRTWV